VRGAFVIARREMASFFGSPMAYVVLTVWLVVSGLSFEFVVEHFAQYAAAGASDTPLRGWFQMPLIYIAFLVFAPILTMRLIAEERQAGRLEGLMTAPVSTTGVVFGKYIAAMSFWLALWLPTTFYVIILSRYGDVDLGAVGSAYLGVLLLGFGYMAVGLLASAVAGSQVVAAVLATLFLSGTFVLGLGEYFFSETLSDALAYVNVYGHMEQAAAGVLDSRRVVYQLSFAALCLFLTVRVLDYRRYA
jgi:ABC-2 type transport system permease protein